MNWVFEEFFENQNMPSISDAKIVIFWVALYISISAIRWVPISVEEIILDMWRKIQLDDVEYIENYPKNAHPWLE